MADTLTKEERSKLMSKIKNENTLPELTLRQLLSKMRYRYKTYYGIEKIDIAFPAEKVVIFVDGCFWHSCPKHFHIPKSNRLYWLPKLKKNIERSKKKDQRLKKEGWKVVHIWEHEVIKNSQGCANKVVSALSGKKLS